MSAWLPLGLLGLKAPQYHFWTVLVLAVLSLGLGLGLEQACGGVVLGSSWSQGAPAPLLYRSWSWRCCSWVLILALSRLAVLNLPVYNLVQGQQSRRSTRDRRISIRGLGLETSQGSVFKSFGLGLDTPSLEEVSLDNKTC